jgi:hypothetical protein
LCWFYKRKRGNVQKAKRRLDPFNVVENHKKRFYALSMVRVEKQPVNSLSLGRGAQLPIYALYPTIFTGQIEPPRKL